MKKVKKLLSKEVYSSLDFEPINFGVHLGKTPEEIAQESPSYIVWLYDAIKPLRCSKALRDDCANDVKTTQCEEDDQDDVLDTYDKFN